jgi:hypothetical protein
VFKSTRQPKPTKETKMTREFLDQHIAEIQALLAIANREVEIKLEIIENIKISLAWL